MSETGTKNRVLAITAIASFMAAFDALVVTTALSNIRADLNASIEALEWIVNAYNLCFAVLLLTGAALGDRFGRRRMFRAGLALFTAASAACALSENAGQLIAARAVQGAGAALIMPLAMALLSAAFPREERGKALGIFGSITGLALIVGPVIGGAIAAGLAWPWIFWLNLPVGIATLWLARRIPESRGEAAFDFGGLALASLAALGVAWALMRANVVGWSDLTVSVPLAIGIVLGLAFIAHQRRIATPMVPMRLFALRGFAAGNAASFFFYAAMYGVVFFLPQYLAALGNDALGAGLRLLPWTATLFVFAPVGGALVNKVGERPLVVIGVLMQAFGFAWIAFEAAALSYPHLIGPLLIAGAGVSLAMPAAQNAVLSAVAPADIGKAAGVFNMLRYLGGTFGIAVQGVAFAACGGFGAFGSGFTAAISVAAALSLGGALAALALPGRRTAFTTEPQLQPGE